MKSILSCTVSITIIISLLLFSCLAIAANQSPSVGTITPSSGSSKPNETVSFITTYSDPDGW